MWSNNKKIDAVINVLLFLLGLNFLYIGQYLLPIICLVIFISNKCKFRVNNIKMFILLCIFSLTYWLFSINLGLYGLISFCLPMCYYIGSNLKDKSKFKYALYSITLGMASHLIVNLVNELIIYYFDLMNIFSKSNHIDFWLNKKVNSTLTALNSVFLIGCLYYVMFYEHNKKIKYINVIVYILALFYSFALGRRTTPILILITLFVAFILDIFLIKHDKLAHKTVILSTILILFVILLTYIIFINNVFGIYDKLIQTRLFQKLITQGLSSGRLDILIQAIKIAPNHLWGGREILNELGSFVHDLWGDIYDYSGIIPYALMIVISIICVKNIINFLLNKEIDKKTKILVIPWFVCVCLIAFIEPLMSGGTIFLFSSAIVLSMVETISL